MSRSPDGGCPICNLVAGKAGITLFEDELWTAGVLEGLEVPGWVVLAQRRHAHGPTSMDDAEAAALGPLIKRLAGAIEDATGAERVYVLAYGENAPHWHLLFSPRGREVPIEQRHAEMWRYRHDYVEPTRTREVALAIQRGLVQPA